MSRSEWHSAVNRGVFHGARPAIRLASYHLGLTIDDIYDETMKWLQRNEPAIHRALLRSGLNEADIKAWCRPVLNAPKVRRTVPGADRTEWPMYPNIQSPRGTIDGRLQQRYIYIDDALVYELLEWADKKTADAMRVAARADAQRAQLEGIPKRFLQVRFGDIAL